MKSTEPIYCPRCGARIPDGSLDPQCPACLLSGALDPGADPTVVLTEEGMPPQDSRFSFPCDFGGYRLHGVLGRGGMGTVYDAEHLATARRVALKRLRQRLNSSDMRQRFLREGRLAAGISHPNSLYVFGSEEIEDAPVITMEIAPGGSLQDVLAERGPLPVAEAVDAVLDVLDGLEAAHQAGVLHRDIKPSNCFVAPDGTIKIGDFGLSVSTLAKDDTFATVGRAIMGTPAFAAPEQLRGDDLDLRADIYSVGATLFTLLTGRAPFEGENAVQVVANAVNQKPASMLELRPDVPRGLEPVVMRCLAKEADGRYSDTMALRNALLPHSSRVPEPASMKIRVSAGWIDYLLAFCVPYVVLMLSVGPVEFHVRPFTDQTLFAFRYHLVFLAFGLLYFGLTEGLGGAGLGKRVKGLRVVRTDGRRPGILRAVTRIAIAVLSIEGVRIPFLLATIPANGLAQWTQAHNWNLIITTNVCAWIPVLLQLRARPENGFAAVWDWMTGTRVVIAPKGRARDTLGEVPAEAPAPDARRLGPFQVVRERVPDHWIVAFDPVLRRPIWLLRRVGAGPTDKRRGLARPGRCRWLQTVEAKDGRWDAYEAKPGVPFTSLGNNLPWHLLREWLHDVSSELWEAHRDGTSPSGLGLEHIWITQTGHAVVLDQPWPECESLPAPGPSDDRDGPQRLLQAMAATVDPVGLPLHARPVLRNLAEGRLEKTSFLAGTLRGMLDRPVDVSRGVRAGSMALMPLYLWVLVVIGMVRENPWGMSAIDLMVWVAVLVFAILAIAQLFEFPFRTTASHSICRLAVVNHRGECATRRHLLARWAVVWLPLALPIIALAWREPQPTGAIFAILCLWVCAAALGLRTPQRGLHDRIARTWVVRQ